jgi:hypothetical protein
MNALSFTLPLREGRKIAQCVSGSERVRSDFSGRGPAVPSTTYPSPKFGRIAALRSTNFDPPSRGGWSSSRFSTGDFQ